MERLTFPEYTQRFADVLAEERLDDLSQFYREGFFDEIPLYSRSSQVAFLDALDRRTADRVILGLGLTYLDELVQFGHPAAEFLAAVTVFDFGKNERLVPGIFVCHGKVDEVLKGRLRLRAPKSVFGARVSRIVSELGGAERYEVLQDTLSVPRKVKVFIGCKSHPDPQMVAISAFKGRDREARGAGTKDRPAPHRGGGGDPAGPPG